MNGMPNYIFVSGKRCEVEMLGRSSHEVVRGHPSWEVFAPDGYEFSGGETSLCFNTKKDLDQIEEMETLTAIVP